MRGVDSIILEGTRVPNVSEEDLLLMKKDRLNLTEYLTKKYKLSRYNNKATTLTNLTYFAVSLLTYPDDEHPIAWHRYALKLISDTVKTPNTTEQNGYEISASNYLVQTLAFAQPDVFDSIRLSYSKDIVAYSKIPLNI